MVYILTIVSSLLYISCRIQSVIDRCRLWVFLAYSSISLPFWVSLALQLKFGVDLHSCPREFTYSIEMCSSCTCWTQPVRTSHRYTNSAQSIYFVSYPICDGPMSTLSVFGFVVNFAFWVSLVLQLKFGVDLHSCPREFTYSFEMCSSCTCWTQWMRTIPSIYFVLYPICVFHQYAKWVGSIFWINFFLYRIRWGF